MINYEAEEQVPTSYMSTISRWCKYVQLRFYAWPYLGWLIVVVSSINVVCIGGKRRAFGVFIAGLKASFNETSMTELNWIGDSYASLGFFLMPFATTLIVHLDRPYRMTMFVAGVLMFISDVSSAFVTAPGYLFLTHTLIHGVASTMVLCSTSLITGDYFDKSHPYHVLATAFISGGPYGALIFGPLFSSWINEYSWQMAFIFTGFFFLGVAWVAAVVFVCRQDYAYSQQFESSSPSHDKSSNCLDKDCRPSVSGGRGWAFCSREHLKQNPQVILWALERFCHNLVMYGTLMNMTAFTSQAMGNQLVSGSKINLYFGIGESIVFTVGALVGDRIKGHLALVYFFGAVAATLVLFLMERLHRNISVFLFLGGLAGAATGVGNTFLYATAEEIMLMHGSIAFPVTKMIAGIGMLMAPLSSGAIIDKFGFNGFFVVMTILVGIRAALLAGICFLLQRKRDRSQEPEEGETDGLPDQKETEFSLAAVEQSQREMERSAEASDEWYRETFLTPS